VTLTHALVAGVPEIRINRKPASKGCKPDIPACARGPDNKDAASLAIRVDLLSRIFAAIGMP
jgi:hypothetical protein